MKKWAVVECEQPLQCIESEDLVPKGKEVLLEVTHCGVCHSDLHTWKGYFDMGGGQIMKITERGVKLPCAPGHEIVGKVIAMGADAKGVAIGDRRIIYPWMGCGKCELCLSDRENMCYTPTSLGIYRDGGFASQVIVPSADYLVDYGDIDPALASTFACSGITVYSAIKKLFPLDPQKPLLLVGAGGLGLTAIAMLRALGYDNLISVDISADKRQAALNAGARYALDGSLANAVEAITAAAGGPLQAAIDFVNVKQTASVALECLVKGGKLVLVGVGGGDMMLSLPSLIFRPRSIIGTITGSKQDLRDVVALAQSGKLAPLPVTRMPKDQANEAMALLKSGQVTGRLVLEESP
ncbi:MAG: alcohol dehydrogenase [Porticoccaceae bacterium]|nr:alcohol dehydrogenase [Porticoccaceae bacterium]